MTSSTSQPPNSISSANVTILGGGPCGLFAAISLSERGIPVTVLERNLDYSRIDKPRSYTLGVTERGRIALETVPGVFDHLRKGAVTYRNFLYVARLLSDASALYLKIPRKSFDGGSRILSTRFGIVNRLHDFIKRYDGVRLLEGACVRDVHFLQDGNVEVAYEKDGEMLSIQSRFVLACDGRNSALGRAVENASKEDQNILSSRNGLGKEETLSGSSHMFVKSCLLSKDILEHYKGKLKEDQKNFQVLLFDGLSDGRPDNECFDFAVYQNGSDETDSIGGHLGSVVRPADNAIWALRDVEEGYRLLEENFPQLRVRDCIAPKDLQEFIDAKALSFGSTVRRKSLSVHVGASVRDVSSGGFVFLGDAAHSFPPDTGQGVNSAFQDVQVLMEVIDGSEKNASLGSILERYEETRGEDVFGLVRVARFANPYQWQKSLAATGFKVNSMLRRKLAKVFPGVFHPPMKEMLGERLTYSEINRLADETTARLCFAVVSVLLIPVIGVIALRFSL